MCAVALRSPCDQKWLDSIQQVRGVRVPLTSVTQIESLELFYYKYKIFSKLSACALKLNTR